ncbi:MAG: hypothetical protein ACMZI0_17780 [Symbiopectobacterium sp.]|uniref:hypothetical protein n=1 Tax=Symbiopectobacterium sp. TaxID=2952789 RepID=UPI0039E91264
MSICHEQLFRILYHPLAYTHRSHLPQTWQADERTCEPLLNYWLHRHYQLTDLPTSWRTSDTVVTAVMQQWYRMLNIAHLLGGYLFKSAMSAQSLTLFSDPQLRTFIALPMAHLVEIPPQKPGKPTTQALGAAFILSQCNSLPLALQQRFMLLFSTDIVLPKIRAPRAPEHINLFNMAIHYANCFSGRVA